MVRSPEFRSLLRLPVALLASIALLTAGCGGGSGTVTVPPPTTPAAVTQHGTVMGGAIPVSGATIQLYAVGTSGDGSAATPLLNPAVTTDASGNFTMQGSEACPSATSLVYLVASGGNPGLAAGTNNSALVLIAALGPCSNLTANAGFLINELTTVAAVYALAPYITSPTAIGSSSGNAAALTAAFTLAAEYANPTTGTVPGASVPAGDTVPVAQINTLADILASCVDTTGGKAGDSSPCGVLLSLTTAPGAAAPGNTLVALLNLANNPTLNLAALFNLASGSGPFQPIDAQVPLDFSVHLMLPSALQFSPATGLAFPSTPVATPTQGITLLAAQTVTLTNTGTSAITLSGISIAGVNAGDFAISPSNGGQTATCTNSLQPSASCGVTVTFNPAAAGIRVAYLVVASSAANSPLPILLTGTGTTSYPTLSLSATTLNFGPQNLNTPSAAQTVTLTNSGNAPLTFTGVTVTGTNSSDFTLNNACTGSVAPNGHCTFSVAFNPTAAGARVAAVHIASNSFGSVPVVNLTGTGGVPTISLTASTLSFGSQNVGIASAAQIITLTNSGSVPLTLSSITVAGANPGDFAESTTCVSPIAASATCAISVAAKPTAAGTRSAQVLIASNASSSPNSIGLSTTGVVLTPAVALAPNALTFPAQTIATTSAAQTVTLTNTGSATLNLASLTLGGTNSADYTLANTACAGAIPAGASCAFSVTFTPSVTGTRTATVQVVSDAPGSPASLPITGTGGTAGPVLLSTSNLYFYKPTASQPLVAQPVVLSNIGNTPLAIQNIALSSTNYTQTNDCGTSLAAQSSCTVMVTSANQAANYTGTLTIQDNDTADAQTVQLASYFVYDLTARFDPSLVGQTQTTQILGGVVTGTDGPITFVTYTVNTPPDTPFTGGTCSGKSGLPCDVTLSFSPTSPGVYNALTTDNAGKVVLLIASAVGSTGTSFSLSPSPLDFSSVTVKNIVTKPLTLTNYSFSPLVFNNPATIAVGASSGDFTVNSSECIGKTIPALTFSNNTPIPGTCPIYVTFTPSVLGSRSAIVTITNPSGVSQSALVEGRGNYAPPTSISALAFPSTPVGSSSSLSLTVTRPNQNPMSTSQPAGSPFTLNSATCAQGASTCQFNITFTPTAPTSYTSALVITDTASGLSTTTNLTGTGQGAAITLTPTSADYQQVRVGGVSYPYPFSLTNSGTSPLTLNSIALAGTNPGDFLITANNCASPIAAQASCSFSVQAQPTVAGTRNGQIVITSNAVTAVAPVPLTVVGTLATLSLSPNQLTFASQTISTPSAPQTITVTNTGAAQLNLTGFAITGTNASDFALSKTCQGTLPAGAQCSVSITFTPNVGGARTAALTITSDSSTGTATVSLTGTGGAAVAYGPVTLSATNLYFYSGPPQQVNTPQQVSLSNLGAIPLPIASMDLTSGYTQTNDCGTSLAAQSSCTITVTSATPNANYTGTLTIHDSDTTDLQTVQLQSYLNFQNVLDFGGFLQYQNAPGPLFYPDYTGTLSGISSPFSVGGCDFGPSCSLTIAFDTSHAPGTFNQIVTDSAGTNTLLRAIIFGEPVNSFVFSPSPLDFKDVTAGTTATLQLTVSYSFGVFFSAAPTLTTGPGNNAAFTADASNCLNPPPYTVPSCFINITFSPTVLGAGSSVLTFTDDNGASASVLLKGLGNYAPPTAPATLAFGILPTPTSSTKAVAITLPSQHAATAALSTAGGPFSIDPTSCASGASACQVNVTFASTTPGTFSNTLVVTDTVSGRASSTAITATAGASAVAFSVPSLAFATTVVGNTSATQTVTLRNPGNEPLNINTITLGGANPGDFTLTNNCVSPLAVNAFCTLTVASKPTANGPLTAQIVVTSDAFYAPAPVTLSGTGASTPNLAVQASNPFVLPTQVAGTTGSPQNILLVNNGVGTLNFTSITLAGANASDFSLTNPCPATLPGTTGACTLAITFHPAAAATGVRTATLQIISNNPTSPNTLQFTGTAVAVGTNAGPVTLSPSALAFPDFSAQFVTVTNGGSTPLEIQSINMTPGYTVQSNPLAPTPCGTVVVAGASCQIGILPPQNLDGPATGTLTLVDNDTTDAQTVALTQTLPFIYEFGAWPVGTPSAYGYAFTVTSPNIDTSGGFNTAILNGTITGPNAGDFIFAGPNGSNCFQRQTISGCSLTIEFNPTVVGPRFAILTTIDVDNVPRTYTLSGIGTAVGAPAAAFIEPLSPTTITQGTSGSYTLQLLNTGATTLQFNATSFATSSPDGVINSNTCGTALTIKGSCQLILTYTPTVAAPGIGNLKVSATDTASGQTFSITLRPKILPPVISISPSSLDFAPTHLNATSASQTITIENPDGHLLNLYANIDSSGTNPFLLSTSSCSATICSALMTFRPTTASTLPVTGTFEFVDTVNNVVGTISLSGYAGIPNLTFTPGTTLAFPPQGVNTFSPQMTVVVSNTGDGYTALQAPAITGDFSGSNLGGPLDLITLAPNGTISLYYEFTPTTTGTRTTTVPLSASYGIPGAMVNSITSVTLTGTGIPALPTGLSFSPVSLTFPSRTVDFNGDLLSTTVTNTGSTPIVLGTIAITGANASDFTLDSTSTCAATLNGGSSCNLAVGFIPSAAGTRSAAIAFNSGTPSAFTGVPLTGVGIAPTAGPVTLSATSLTFARYGVPQTVTLTNNGTGPLTFNRVTLPTYPQVMYGMPYADFVVEGSNTCSGTIAAGAQCTIPVAANSFNLNTTATLNIVDDAAAGPQTVALSYTGPAFGLPAVYDFGSHALGTETDASFTVYNPQPGASVSITGSLGGVNAQDFALSASESFNSYEFGCSFGYSEDLCGFEVAFLPSASGLRTAAVNISGGGASGITTFTGTGLAGTTGYFVLASPALSTPISSTSQSGTIAFPPTFYGTNSSPIVVTITNNGGGPITLNSSVTGSFTAILGSACTNLAANASCTLSLTASPTQPGNIGGVLTVSSTDSQSVTISLAVNALDHVPVITPSSLTFPTTAVGATSAPIPVTVTSFNNEAVFVYASGPFQPSAGTTCAQTPCQVNITYTPTATGGQNGQITATDQVSNKSASIGVSGTGSAPVAGIMLTPSNLSFTSYNSPQSLTLTNPSSSPLAISSITIAASTQPNVLPFSQTNNCGSPSIASSITITTPT